jgi:hypothetical protein
MLSFSQKDEFHLCMDKNGKLTVIMFSSLARSAIYTKFHPLLRYKLDWYRHHGPKTWQEEQNCPFLASDSFQRWECIDKKTWCPRMFPQGRFPTLLKRHYDRLHDFVCYTTPRMEPFIPSLDLSLHHLCSLYISRGALCRMISLFSRKINEASSMDQGKRKQRIMAVFLPE